MVNVFFSLVPEEGTRVIAACAHPVSNPRDANTDSTLIFANAAQDV